MITCNRSLPNMLNIIAKNWSILQISLTPPKVFDNKPMITYNQKKKNKKKTNLVELIGGHTTRRKSLQDSSSNIKW